MHKLKPWRILQIIDSALAGYRGSYRIARQHKVSPRWVRHLVKRYRETGQVPQARPCGRRPKAITAKEIMAVSEAYERHHCGAVKLEKAMKQKLEIELPHNRIHKILRQLKLAKHSYKKSKRRKWVRFERYKSNSLWHTDWTKIGNLWLIAYIDDASRFVSGWGLFKNATAENSILVLERAIAAYGIPKAMLTGHDTQFFANQQKGSKPSEPNEFQKFLKAQGIKHILGRVNHPQTNGKVERLFGTVKQKRHEFASLEELFHWYNHVRLHMSLSEGSETPAEAYVRKGRSKKKMTVEVVVR